MILFVDMVATFVISDIMLPANGLPQTRFITNIDTQHTLVPVMLLHVRYGEQNHNSSRSIGREFLGNIGKREMNVQEWFQTYSFRKVYTSITNE